jgi:hypothetical protein
MHVEATTPHDRATALPVNLQSKCPTYTSYVYAVYIVCMCQPLIQPLCFRVAVEVSSGGTKHSHSLGPLREKQFITQAFIRHVRRLLLSTHAQVALMHKLHLYVYVLAGATTSPSHHSCWVSWRRAPSSNDPGMTRLAMSRATFDALHGADKVGVAVGTCIRCSRDVGMGGSAPCHCVTVGRRFAGCRGCDPCLL